MRQQEPEEILKSEVESEVAEAEEETLESALVTEKKRSEEYLANWQRAQANFINYKRRIEQEREDFNKYANTTLILSLLPILDDLERALNSTPPKQAKASWVEGVRLTERKFRTILEAQGLTPIKSLGEPFDPRFHEAIRQDKGKEGIVVEEFQKGYMLHDRVIRPTMVVVGNGEEDEKEEK